MTDRNDFYEDDEPIEKIREAFDRGEQGYTSAFNVADKFELVQHNRDRSGNPFSLVTPADTPMVGHKTDEHVRQAS